MIERRSWEPTLLDRELSSGCPVRPVWELMKTDCLSPCHPSSLALSSSGGTDQMPPSNQLEGGERFRSKAL